MVSPLAGSDLRPMQFVAMRLEELILSSYENVEAVDLLLFGRVQGFDKTKRDHLEAWLRPLIRDYQKCELYMSSERRLLCCQLPSSNLMLEFLCC